MRTLVIINPRSGGREDLSKVASIIRHHPSLSNPEIRITGEPGDGRLLAAAGAGHDFERIVAVGGDGTMNEVLNGMLDRKADLLADDPAIPILGVLPRGTGNDLARTLDLPLDLEEALDALVGGRTRRVDIVHVSGSIERYFINASAGGFSGDVDRKVTPERKESWGPLAYLRGALDVLPDPEVYRAELELPDGESLELDVVNIVVANGRTVAGGIPVAPGARLDDGLLDVVAVRAAPLRALAGFASRCLVGRHMEHDLVVHRRTACVTIRSRPQMTFNLDGELGVTGPLTYRVVPGAVRFMVPGDAEEG